MVKVMAMESLVILFLMIPSLCISEDVITCTGMIKSGHKLDFSKIDINLYTRSELISETSECAPNNGYFVVPVYDKGDYTLKVSPPKGWGFDPMEVKISIDGETDICSRKEDIFFHFTGFTIYGQVSNIGQIIGPSGVKVHLSGIEGNEVLKETFTVENGMLQLLNIFPGKYEITASHPVWTISKDPVKIEVSSDNIMLPANSIVVEGYDVKGHIESNDEPVGGVQFLLYPQNGNQAGKISCEFEQAPHNVSNAKPPSCVAISSSDGSFSFQSLPAGDYQIIPHYQNADSKFEVSPKEVKFSVINESVIIKPLFEVHGFTVSGRVLLGPEGEGIEGAGIYFGDEIQGKTDDNGHFQLLNVSTGSYNIKVESTDVQFDPVKIELNPSSSRIPDFIPTRYSVCGSVQIRVHPSQKYQTGSRSVEVVLESDLNEVIKSTLTDKDGHFCFVLPPEKYQISTQVTSEEIERGLVLIPTSLPVIVNHSPVKTILFEQFTGSLTGTVNCIGTCLRLQISLQRLNSSEMIVQTQITPMSTTFQFHNVLPGKYKVSLSTESYVNWCWSEKEFEVDIPTSGTHPPLLFSQTGFLLEIESSHDTDVEQRYQNEELTIINVHRGLNKICLNKSGEFSFIPKSCYQFEGDLYIFITSMPAPLQFKAVSHTLNVSVVAPENSSVEITVSFSDSKRSTNLKPLSSDKPSDVREVIYHYSFTGSPKVITTLTPHSNKVLCSPESQTHTIGDECPEQIPSFHCSQGVFIKGHIEPPLEGVNISITLINGRNMNVVSDENGDYKAGPLPDGIQHKVDASMSQYLFQPLSDDLHSFKAIKMSQITIKVNDSSGNILSGVLLSVNGDDLRATNITGEDGQVIYTNVNPGQYYVKPILREYEFQPTSQVIELNQGENLLISFTGKRVAFSASGRVMSLNRTPLQGVMIEIKGQGESKCNLFREQVSSDDNGLYRFRGLLPDCVYVLSVMTTEESSIERGIPKERIVKITEDITDEEFVAVLKPSKLTITGNVVTNTPEHINTLKVTVYGDKYFDNIVHITSPDAMGFFDIPIKVINPSITYYVQLESTLSNHYYKTTFNSTSFSTNDDNHITLYFSAEPISIMTESSSRGSFIGIFLAIATIFALANAEKVYQFTKPFLTSLIGGATTNRKTLARK